MKLCCFVFIFFLLSCANISTQSADLQLSDDELVSALVHLYTAQSAININDVNFRDSTSKVYFQQVEKMIGKPMSVIQADFEKLKEMPDSLLVLQGRALDTLRVLQENQILKPKTISIGLN